MSVNRALQSAGDGHFQEMLCRCCLPEKKRRSVWRRRWDNSVAWKGQKRGQREQVKWKRLQMKHAVGGDGGWGVQFGMREIKNEGRGVRERESKQARQKNQSGERDNPALFIYSSYFQGTSHEAFSFNIWWTLWPRFTVLTLYLQGPRVQGCVKPLQRTPFSCCLSCTIRLILTNVKRWTLIWISLKSLCNVYM